MGDHLIPLTNEFPQWGACHFLQHSDGQFSNHFMGATKDSSFEDQNQIAFRQGNVCLSSNWTVLQNVASVTPKFGSSSSHNSRKTCPTQHNFPALHHWSIRQKFSVGSTELHQTVTARQRKLKYQTTCDQILSFSQILNMAYLDNLMKNIVLAEECSSSISALLEISSKRGISRLKNHSSVINYYRTNSRPFYEKSYLIDCSQSFEDPLVKTDKDIELRYCRVVTYLDLVGRSFILDLRMQFKDVPDQMLDICQDGGAKIGYVFLKKHNLVNDCILHSNLSCAKQLPVEPLHADACLVNGSHMVYIHVVEKSSYSVFSHPSDKSQKAFHSFVQNPVPFECDYYGPVSSIYSSYFLKPHQNTVRNHSLNFGFEASVELCTKWIAVMLHQPRNRLQNNWDLCISRQHQPVELYSTEIFFSVDAGRLSSLGNARDSITAHSLFHNLLNRSAFRQNSVIIVHTVKYALGHLSGHYQNVSDARLRIHMYRDKVCYKLSHQHFRPFGNLLDTNSILTVERSICGMQRTANGLQQFNLPRPPVSYSNVRPPRDVLGRNRPINIASKRLVSLERFNNGRHYLHSFHNLLAENEVASMFSGSISSIQSTFPSDCEQEISACGILSFNLRRIFPSLQDMYPRSYFHNELVVDSSNISNRATFNTSSLFRDAYTQDDFYITSRRLLASGFPEALSGLDHIEQDEVLSDEETVSSDATSLDDEYSALRLDIDDMSYEELLALEDRIGYVSTGISEDAILRFLEKCPYAMLKGQPSSHLNIEVKCSICQEEYEETDDVGKLICNHIFHVGCINQWLTRKNKCPICSISLTS